MTPKDEMRVTNAEDRRGARRASVWWLVCGLALILVGLTGLVAILLSAIFFP
jgi:hypothetical protein